MALGATVYHLQVQLSDVDRGVYEALDLRVARHPSESMRFLCTRTLAYCLCFEEGLTFSKGLSTADEPAVWRHHPDGRIALWIDVGTPGAERLHKASKASERVVVFTQHDPELVLRAARERPIHRAAEIELYAVETSLLDALESKIDRNSSFDLTRTDG